MKKQVLLFTVILISGLYACNDSSESKVLSVSELESLIIDSNSEENLIQNGFEKLPENQGNSSLTITFAKGKKKTAAGKTYWTQMVDKPKGRVGIGYSVTDEKKFLDLKKQVADSAEDKGVRRGAHFFNKENGNNFVFKIDSSKKDVPISYRMLIEQRRNK